MRMRALPCASVSIARRFSYWSSATDGWKVDDGVYEVCIGASSRDIRLSVKVTIRDGKLALA